MFTATRLQVATYLLGVCPFAIAFLVFLNSSVSFVITDLVGVEKGVGNAVGNLGFADEMVALVACPLWGLLSDRVGVRTVCVLGYLIIAVALVLFVQAKNVYPQLLLGRLFFSIGGAAASTMVTAVLPTMSYASQRPLPDAHGSIPRPAVSNRHVQCSSIASELTITPARYRTTSEEPNNTETHELQSLTANTSRVAGLVGMFTGCGALLALLLFLPLPARFQLRGIEPGAALQYSYYIVAAVAIVLAAWCFFGLRQLQSEAGKTWRGVNPMNQHAVVDQPHGHNWHLLYQALVAGFKRADIAIGYLGGFVARASSVGISLFIPLLVNALFLKSGLCSIQESADNPTGLPDIKRRCPRAYVVAAELTGVSQMVALISAPVFGYVSASTRRKGLPLIFAAACGVIGYPLFATQFDPDDENRQARVVSFLAVCLIGFSQIGAIVCSLATLSAGILVQFPSEARKEVEAAEDTEPDETDEHTGLINEPSPTSSTDSSLSSLKGSVAGIYSFYGGLAILILTKAGGVMFDRVSTAAPFYIMAAFNAILLAACTLMALVKTTSRLTTS